MHRYSLFPIPDSRFPIPDSRFPIPDSRFPIPYCFLLLHCRTNTLSKRFSHFF
ncbi:hypothetical protein [Moorena sp. SIO4G3]|uniref:hypothetical protein n=1 Tax=Moorena sp. SIO4G3 TaxID=2607821 RepID=UPI001428E8E7|nr:hypothetical protein [Moorena sp. SIO4G3]NEO75424.1 hypothetical protein [Moorena sp. SIO4G3]